MTENNEDIQHLVEALDAAAAPLEAVADPEADAEVDDALEIDSALEAEAAYEALSDEGSEAHVEEVAEEDAAEPEVDPYGRAHA